MGLPRKAYTGNHLETEVLVNVFCLKEKGKILFTGNLRDCGDFIGISREAAKRYVETKCRCKKKYALRHAKQLTPEPSAE